MAGLFFPTAPVFAQSETDPADDVDLSEAEEIIVTGSRLKRDTYTSISPLQVITSEVSREVGLIDASEILQDSTAASGQQIDLSLSNFVTDSGPGASSISLRGLGDDRTLVLLNGRRLAPAGVEGAPSAADLNLVPSSLVQQYDLLLDGASSIYGSDAVGGVVNIILRKDFNGAEFETYSQVPEQGAGVEHTLSAVWGKNFDRGFVGIGAEYTDIEAVTLADREWTDQCQRHVEIDQFGRIRTVDLSNQVTSGMAPAPCTTIALAARHAVDPFAREFGTGYGSVYYTPGFSNSGIPNFSESSQFGAGIDIDGDGQTDMDFLDYALDSRAQEAHLFPELSRKSVMAYGEYTFDGDMNVTPYFETLLTERDFFIDLGSFQLFPHVPADNPFNPCNPAAAGGVDCGLAFDALMNDPEYIAAFTAVNGAPPSAFGLGDDGPAGAVGTTPIVSVEGDRTTNPVEVRQVRAVVGLRGDLPQLQWGPLDNFGFDLAAAYSKSEGTSSRPGVRDDRLNLALGGFSTTGTPCVNDTGVELAPDAAPGCVPVNMFAPSLYEGVVGDFATAAERAYVFDSRDFDTEYTQKIVTGFLSGEMFELPAGPVSAGLGIERREDEIRSIPDAVARDGLLSSFFADGGATGEKYTQEYFGEIEIPVLADLPAVEQLTANLSTRYTRDEFYGSAWTHSYKLGYRPVESLLLRATLGTSYRAPNLRENFLQSQTGFNNYFDPCAIPDAAIDPLGGYNPALDSRDQSVLDNCVRTGVDPTALNFNGFNTYSIEISAGGVLDLFEEESESWSAGFAWEQPLFDAFDLTVGATYYEIEINNAIIEPTGQFIINDCYNTATLDSPFCSRLSRDATGHLDFISAGFLNRDNETVRGTDINIAYDQEVAAFGRDVGLGADLTLNRSYEAAETFLDDNGAPTYHDFQGEFGLPDWRGRLNLRADFEKLRVTWSVNYLGAVAQDPASLDEFGNALDGTAETCLGPTLGDVNCRDVAFAGDYFLHAMSIYYYGDVWTFGGGMRNVFDQAPPLVDPDESLEVTSINNVPVGYGYDLNGRTYFVNVAASFGGE